jgi:hypothetical protein
VLDGKSVRGPVARSFALGVLSGAVLVAAPLAAVTFTPATPHIAKSKLTASARGTAYSGQAADQRADLPGIIAQGVSASVATATAAIGSRPARDEDFTATAPNGASIRSVNGTTVARAPNGATVTVYPPDAQGRRKVVAVAPNGATAISYADADEDVPDLRRHHADQTNDPIQRAIEMKAVGVTPDYVAAMRAASPALRGADTDDFVGMKAVGVTPEYVHALAAAGFANLDADALTGARAVGVDPEYVRAMRAAGYGSTLDDFVEMRAVGVTPAYAEQFRRAGYKVDKDKLIDLKANGVDLNDLRNQPLPPPAPPAPPPRRR